MSLYGQRTDLMDSRDFLGKAPLGYDRAPCLLIHSAR
jgi:hypothetical protein